MDKYKVYNETKSQWEDVIADVVPTQCPDNPGDTMRAGSQVILEEGIRTNPDGIATELTLPNYKALKLNAIDDKSGELISNGYVYQSLTFSLSQNAQINLTNIYMIRDLSTYPINYNNIDNTTVYAITDATDMSNMYFTALGTKKGVLDSGTVLKEQVEAAVDEAGVDAVIDNR